jgi:sigma-B regulation protein RsbU (phosphoserine phosphatase)
LSDPVTDPAPTAPVDFEDLFENAPCGYLVLGQDGRIVRANSTITRWLGVEPSALEAKRLRDLLTLPGRILYETNVAPVLRLQGQFEEVALDLVMATGEKLPILANATEQRNAAGDLVAVRIAVFRATERRGWERQLLGRLDDELSTSELREQFIAVLGHDLRNPLASIVAATRILRREPLTEKSRGVLKMMETSVQRMGGLIDDIMDFARSRLGSGIDLQRSIADLGPVLRQVVAELEVDEPGRTITCDFYLPEPISFDQGRIAQLVSNLLGNALVHGDPSQPVRLTAVVAEGRLELSVANAGSPIPPAALERLFQPFFRGEVRPTSQGLGLGLHIASEIARAHDGSLRATSDPQETRFILSMPAI